MATWTDLWKLNFAVSVRHYKNFGLVDLLVFDGSSCRGLLSRMVVSPCPNIAQLSDTSKGVKP
jgi:hypothetical protein